MKTSVQQFLLFAALFPITPVCGQAPAPPAPTTKPTMDDLFRRESLNAAVIAPDGKSTMYMIQNELGVNLWIADSTGGTRSLTSGNQIDENPRWSPDSQWMAFKSDRVRKPESAGRHQVWLVPSSGGEAVQLTREKFDVRTLEWSPDGKSIAVLAQEASTSKKKELLNDDGTEVAGAVREEYCIFLISVPDGRAELLYGTERPISSFSFSPKGDEIVFADQPNWREPEGRFHSIVKVLGVASKQVRVLSGGELSSSGPLFSPDANWIAFYGGPQKNWTANHCLYLIPAAGGPIRQISRDFDEDVRQYVWARDSKSVYFTGSHGMDVNLFRVTLEGKVTPVYLGRGITRSISLATDRIAFIHEEPSEPPNVYLMSLFDHAGTANGGAPKRITDLNSNVRSLALGKIETIRWKNKNDGLEVEGQLLTPPDYRPGHSYPLLVVLHGGPNGQFSNGFVLSNEVYPLQLFASGGYVVFMPNPRGSNGYGQKFREMVLKDWGGADFQDIQGGIDHLIALGIADKDHMGIMGWSYGGYLTAWTITHTDRFRAASVGAGPVNLFTMYGGTDIPEFMESYFGGTPWTVQQLYFTHSPMAYVQRVKTPTLIQHGMNDGRVPTAVSSEFYRALRATGVECELVLYPDSWHNVGSPKLIRDAFTRNLEWFDHHVRAEGTQGTLDESSSKAQATQ